jgi:NAD(P)-dependent dehydrogenase (short-subunit alcohol dehydrogenase family)
VSDRVALVTGSTQGIGAAIARRLTQDGYRVALHGRRPAEQAAALLAELPGSSDHAADLEKVEQAGGLVRDVLAHDGRLDVLVNNAGIVARFPHADLKAATPGVA